MTVRVEREFTIEAPCEDIWAFISDPAKRAEAISVVEGYTVHDRDTGRATWEVRLPIPVIKRTASIETRDLERTPPTFVKFVGRSRVMRVLGEHALRQTDEGCLVRNRFVVDGKLPGVERYFKHNLDGELDNLEAALRRHLENDA